MSTIARFGASVTHHNGRVYLVGGVVKDQMLGLTDEISTVDSDDCNTSPVLLGSNTPRPLLVGVTVANTDDSLVIMGGSAVCFSFGTFWNKGCFTINDTGSHDSWGVARTRTQSWRYLRTVTAAPRYESAEADTSINLADRKPISIPRVRISSAEDFNRLLQAAQPVILEELDIGACTSQWTNEYLKEKVGADREVSLTSHFSCTRSNAKILGDCP